MRKEEYWETVVRKLKEREAEDAIRQAERAMAAILVAEAALRHRRFSNAFYPDWQLVDAAAKQYHQALDAFEAIR